MGRVPSSVGTSSPRSSSCVAPYGPMGSEDSLRLSPLGKKAIQELSATGIMAGDVNPP